MPAVLEGKDRGRNRSAFPATRRVKKVNRKVPAVSHPQEALQTPGKRAELFQRLLLFRSFKFKRRI